MRVIAWIILIVCMLCAGVYSETVVVTSEGESSKRFNNIQTGTNTTATMTVGSGASIVPSGSGVIQATSVPGISVNGHALTGNVTVTKGDVSLGNVTNDAQLKRSADDWNLFGEKTAVVDNDWLLIEDSEDALQKKKVRASNIGTGGGGGGAPTNAKYVVTEANGGLSSEVNLGALTTGLLKMSVSGGVATLSTGVSGTDYPNPSTAVTAASNYTNGELVQAAGSNRTTSSSGVATANVVTAGSSYTSGNLVQAAGNDKTTSDSGIATANVPTAASNFTNGNILKAGGNNKTIVDGGIAATSLATLDGTQKLTNKRIQLRVKVHTDTASVTVDSDSFDAVTMAEASQALTIAAPTGTPDPKQALSYSFTSTTSRALTWNSAFSESAGVALPAKTIAGARLTVDTEWNATSSKWDVILVSQKRPKACALTDGATIAVDVAACPSMFFTLASVAGNRQFLNPTGTFTDGQQIEIRVISSAVRTWTWDTKYSANGTIALPVSTTGGNFEDRFVYEYREDNDTWVIVSTTQATAVPDAAADGVTKGVVAFTAADFNCTAGVCSIDYTNAQAASGSNKGFLTSAAYTAFNKGYIHLPVIGAHQPTSNPGIIDRSENHERLLFDATTQECVWWGFRMPSDYAGGLVAKIPYSMVSATSGGVSVDTFVMATTPGDSADENTDSYGSVNNCDDAAVPGTAGYLDEISCTQTNADSVAAGDSVRFKLCRAPADSADTATGDMEVLYEVMLEYTKQ